MEKIELPLLMTPRFGEFNLDDLVEELQAFKNDQVNYYFDFLGHVLYSDTVTLDSAYQEVYKMSKEEYQKDLKESYEKYKKAETEYWKEIKRKAVDKKEKIYSKVREVIPEDKIIYFDNIQRILLPHGIIMSDDNKVDNFLELINELNKDDYSLELVNNLFNRIKSMYVFDNNELLKSIKELSKNGNVLFDELYDEKREREILDSIINVPSLIPSLSEEVINEIRVEPSINEQLISYDRKMTSMNHFGYTYSKRKELKK